VVGSQPAGDMSHKPGNRLPLLSARPAVTLATLNRAATNFGEQRHRGRGIIVVCISMETQDYKNVFDA